MDGLQVIQKINKCNRFIWGEEKLSNDEADSLINELSELRLDLSVGVLYNTNSPMKSAVRELLEFTIKQAKRARGYHVGT